jgi:hypothetical protein
MVGAGFAKDAYFSVSNVLELIRGIAGDCTIDE